MKKSTYYIFIILFGIQTLFFSCTKDLLDQKSTVDLPDSYFWNTTGDALSAVSGVYEATRTLFGRDYYYDGQGEFQWTRGTSLGSGSWNPSADAGSGFDYMWNNAYKVINRANYVQKNLKIMIANETNATTLASLKRIEGESCFLRSLAYFRLIELWGDVPYYTKVLSGNSEAITLSRTPIADIKDSIIADLTYAISVLPAGLPDTERGRATQVAAYGFRGKVQLYWASWKKNGWDELKGFTIDAEEANTYFSKAAEDFKKVVNDYGLKLYSEGDPGTYQKPSYWNLFQASNEYASEIIFSVQYAGPNLGQGQELQRDFGTRSTGDGQCWVMPTYRLVNRYQSTVTGDFAPNLILSSNDKLAGGALNPDTYKNRDWRMKATILWDGQKMLKLSSDGRTVLDSITFKYGSKDGVTYINYDASGNTPGYIFRKWVRQDGTASRSDGPCDFYLMRLADVYLMYCEAVNEVSGPSLELVDLIDKIRKRGNLPGLIATKYQTKDDFFAAIEQERIVELVAEGHRPFDLRRWRKVAEVWPAPGGQVLLDTKNARVRDEFLNASPRDYQRYYINRIPTAERERNPNLTQNEPWL